MTADAADRAAAVPLDAHRGFIDGLTLVWLLGSALKAQFVGEVTGADLVALAAAPLLIAMRGRLLRARAPATILALGAAWLLSQIVSDIVNARPLNDAFRGNALIFVFLCHFVVGYLALYGDRRRIQIAVLAFGAGQIVSAFVFSSYDRFVDQWRFGLAVAAMFFVIGLFIGPDARRRWAIGACVLLALAVFSFMVAARSVSAAMAAAAIAGAYVFLRPKSFGRVSVQEIALLAATALVAGLALFALQNLIAELGLVSEEQQVKRASEQEGEIHPFLAGRYEYLFYFDLIAQNPIFGHGSWARSAEYADHIEQTLFDLGLDLKASIHYGQFQDLLPVHSILFGTWLNGGVMAFVFWCAAIAFILRMAFSAIDKKDQMSFLIYAIAVLSLWHILFSKFGGHMRLHFGFFLAIACLANNQFDALARRNRRLSSGG